MSRAPFGLLFSSFSFSLALAAIACAPNAPAPSSPTPPSSSAPVPSASASASTAPRLQAPNVEALKKALAADGYKVQVSATKDGRVGAINFVAKSPTPRLPHEIFLAVIAAHGDLLGYGVVGEPALGGSSGLSGPIGSMVGTFPNAQACPRLRYEAAFEELDETNRTPRMWAFGCPDSQQDLTFLGQVHDVIQRMSDARKPQVAVVVDPLETWLRAEGIAVDKVSRGVDSVHASMSSAAPLAGDRLAAVKSFAEKVARFEKLPALDTVDLVPFAKDVNDPKSLPMKFRELTLRSAKPPLDGACIDPRVTVQVFDTAAAPPSTPASVRITDVEVACAKEPADGTKPPPDAGRSLPRAASGSLPFVAICESINFAWGYQHSGRVVDKRGDVYTFSGGPPFSGKSAHELAVLLRHGKRYAGTLPPGDVDRLVSLAAQVEREPLQKKAVQVYDAPGGGCKLLRAGASADALIPIAFDELGTTVAKRVGPASSEAEKVLQKAAAVGTRP